MTAAALLPTDGLICHHAMGIRRGLATWLFPMLILECSIFHMHRLCVKTELREAKLINLLSKPVCWFKTLAILASNTMTSDYISSAQARITLHWNLHKNNVH